MFKKSEKTVVKRSKEDLIFDLLNYIVLGAFLLIVLYPLYFIIIASFSDPSRVLSGDVILLPKDLDFSGYQKIFSDTNIWQGYYNTFVYTILGTVLNVVLTMGIGYPLSRNYFSGKKPIMIFLMITMYFGGGMVPTYLLVKDMGLRNTATIMIVMGAVSVFNVIITRSFLEANIPTELEEAASIDGCSQFKFFFRMVLPLSGSIIAVLILYYGIWHWNDYMTGLIYLDDGEKYPLQLIIRSLLIQTQMEANDVASIESLSQRLKVAESIKYGVIIISSLPVLVLYPFLQKHFTKGVLVGAVKG